MEKRLVKLEHENARMLEALVIIANSDNSKLNQGIARYVLQINQNSDKL